MRLAHNIDIIHSALCAENKIKIFGDNSEMTNTADGQGIDEIES